MNSNSNGKSSLLGTAVITGASSGLGKVYADRLAQRGHDLLLVARRADRLQNLAEELRAKYGIEANFIVADLGNSADLQPISDTIPSRARRFCSPRFPQGFLASYSAGITGSNSRIRIRR